METITPQHFLILAFLLFGVGFLGVVIRRNLLLVLMSLELMLNGVNVALVTFSRTGQNLDGSLFVFFIILNELQLFSGKGKKIFFSWRKMDG